MLSGGAGGRAMSRAFEDLYGVADAFNGIPFNGRTDAWILSQTAKAHKLDPAALSDFKPRYLEHLARELQAPGPRKGVMPGVGPLLDALATRDDVVLALLTGNYADGARLKLEYFDLWRYFSCGAFGDVVHERNHLLADAFAAVEARSGQPADPARTIVIGDTPLDVGVALFGGTRSIAVATGSHTMDELRASGADVVFEDLSDLKNVLEALEQAGS